VEICLEPEFSSKTFHGNNSNNYDTYRRIQLKEGFKEIPVTQIMDAMAKMQEKVNELSDEVSEIKDEISGLEDRQDSLREQRAEIKSSNEGNQ